jgi:bifunctional NMN adenylyltransferase/nudix hydrolase
MDVKTPDADLGVIIGRFQVPDLHKGHHELISSVREKHKKVLIFICSTPGILVTRRNPLDYFTRMRMIQAAHSDVVILPLHDMPSDHDWSHTVDQRIRETFNDASAILYGSRDAFIPHYFGRYPTVELADSMNVSGTEVREAVSNEVRAHSEFRRGVVYAAFNKHLVVCPTVDIAAIRFKGTNKQVALGRKANDVQGLWRLPGGFVDPKRDKTFEAAASREFHEEMGVSINVDDLQYVGSRHVDDWRYRSELDQIVTTLFTTIYLWGPLEARDDLAEAKWFDLDGLEMDILVEGHRPLMRMMLNYLESAK